MPQTKDWTKKRPDESFDEYLKRVSKRIKKNKTTDWDKVGRAATQIVKDIRRDKGKKKLKYTEEQWASKKPVKGLEESRENFGKRHREWLKKRPKFK